MVKPWDISSWQPVTCLVTNRVWGAGDLSNEICRRVGFLKARGIVSSDVVFITHNNSLEFLADLFALWALGAVAAALSPTLTLAELENLADFAKPKIILKGGSRKTDERVSNVPVFDLAKEKGEVSDFTLGELDFGLILFTSGTTGEPKGVFHTRSSIEEKIAINLNHFGREIFERSLCVLSSHFVAGLFSNILTPLAAGGEVLLFPDPGVKGASGIGGLIDENRVTFMNSVPSLWNIILKSSSRPRAGSLKFVSIVSAPLNPKTREEIIAWAGTENVHSLYGTTETGGWTTGISGTVIGGEVALLSKDGGISRAGTGELLLKTKACMSGYFKRENLTKEAFIDGWFKTGDLAKIDKEGKISINGRVKAQINRAGIKIIPEEIEALLERHPGVGAACVFSYPDPVTGEGVGAAIEPAPKEKIDFPSLRTWCKSRIRAVSIPEKWFEVSKLPRTERGKIDRRKIAARFNIKGKF